MPTALLRATRAVSRFWRVALALVRFALVVRRLTLVVRRFVAVALRVVSWAFRAVICAVAILTTRCPRGPSGPMVSKIVWGTRVRSARKAF